MARKRRFTMEIELEDDATCHDLRAAIDVLVRVRGLDRERPEIQHHDVYGAPSRIAFGWSDVTDSERSRDT